MFPVTRLYESEHAAHHAVEQLGAAGISPDVVMAIHPSSMDAAAQVDRAVDRGYAMGGHRRSIKQALGRGRSVVTVAAGVGLGSLVEYTLDRAGPVDPGAIVDIPTDDPAPLSDLLSLPVLTKGKSNTRLWTFNSKSSFGFRMLSNKAAPLSSMFGMKVLMASKGSIAKGSSVERMSGKPAPLSSMLGLKLLSSKRGSRARGTSVERMSNNPAPFSSFFGLRVLSKRK